MKGHENKKIYPIPITDHGHGEKHRHLGAGYLFSSILSIKCASTTYMNPFDMFRCEISFSRWSDFIKEHG
jgi:hypothetical protein